MNHKLKYYILIIPFFLILCLGGLSYFIKEKDSFSDYENRYLESEAFPNVENYLKDHIPFRKTCLSIHHTKDLLLNKRISNHIYVLNNGYLSDEFKIYDLTTFKNNLSTLNNYKNPLTILPIPTSNYSLKDDLPLYAYDTNQEDLFHLLQKNIPNHQVLDLFHEFKNHPEYYYRLDHHWNLKGAYVASKLFLESQHKTIDENIPLVTITDDFRGTLYAKSGLLSLHGENLEAIEHNPKVQVTFEDGTISHSLYFPKHLSRKNCYDYYLDGNHSYVSIENLEASNNDHLLVIKDSFAHSMIPYLVPHYKNITMVDLRYYKLPISELPYTNILVLYNMDSLCTDKNILFLK